MQKHYSLGTHTAEQYVEIHNLLCNENTNDDYVPNREILCLDHIDHSPTRGKYFLTDQEAEKLKTDPRIKFIQLDRQVYAEIYHAPEDELKATPNARYTNRYASDVLCESAFLIQNNTNTASSNISAVPDPPRTSWQILRAQSEINPWIISQATVWDADLTPLKQKGAGEDVDVICMDNGTWIAHTEFINRGVPNAVNPADYKGGNVLPGDGYCDVLDIILDAPYYLDPDWFDADPGTRLTQRWDGTIVPQEFNARAWWTDPLQRSAKFAFGSIAVPSFYSRAGVHGSPAAQPSIASADHGTPCASVLYGRNHGFAYNANKWHLNLYGTGGSGIEVGFDVCKIFHQYKPINPKYGTKDPTIGSNSWGYRSVKQNSGYYWYRGGSATQYATRPGFLLYANTDGDRRSHEMYANSMTTAGDELVNSGFIFVMAAGNANQMQTLPGDPHYDNRIGTAATDTPYGTVYTEFGENVTGFTNRPGFPMQLGKTNSQSDVNSDTKYPVIPIGALDNIFYNNLQWEGLETKVYYSNMGPAVDVFSPGDGVIAADQQLGVASSGAVQYDRDDNTYADMNGVCYDTYFNGTSSACPIACGFLATILQYNRNWSAYDLKDWIKNSIPDQLDTNFRIAPQETDVDGTGWQNQNDIQGASPKCIQYPTDMPVSTPNPSFKETRINLKGNVTIDTQFKFKPPPDYT